LFHDIAIWNRYLLLTRNWVYFIAFHSARCEGLGIFQKKYATGEESPTGGMTLILGSPLYQYFPGKKSRIGRK
jgi:hypothetical protein